MNEKRNLFLYLHGLTNHRIHFQKVYPQFCDKFRILYTHNYTYLKTEKVFLKYRLWSVTVMLKFNQVNKLNLFINKFRIYYSNNEKTLFC